LVKDTSDFLNCQERELLFYAKKMGPEGRKSCDHAVMQSCGHAIMRSCDQKTLKIQDRYSTFLVSRYLTEYRSEAEIPTAKLVGTDCWIPNASSGFNANCYRKLSVNFFRPDK